MIKTNKERRPGNKQIQTMRILVIVCAVSILLNLVFMIRFRFKNVITANVYSKNEVSELKGDAKADLLSDMQNRLNDGDSVVSILRDYYPEKLVYADSGKYIFADINHDLKMNTFDKGTFNKDSNNVITYSENGNVVSHKGIDISKYQGDIDFSKVKNSGVEYAMVRCGYRSYGSGVLTEDTSFNTYVTDALKNNINVGVYFFTQAVSVSEAEEEADFVLNMIRPFKVTYPIVLDVEEIFDDSFRQENLSKEELTDVIVAFCEKIKNAGYTPMVYGNLKCFAGMVDMTRLESYEKWFAYYDDEPYLPYEMSMWQYSESGKIDGIDGKVDMDISFKTWN